MCIYETYSLIRTVALLSKRLAQRLCYDSTAAALVSCSEWAQRGTVAVLTATDDGDVRTLFNDRDKKLRYGFHAMRGKRQLRANHRSV